MKNFKARGAGIGVSGSLSGRLVKKGSRRRAALLLMGMLVLLAARVVAQNSPHVAMVAPDMGKVDDTVTITGDNLGKEGVAGAFLSDDTMDYKATITAQAADKIVMKVPMVKAGRYNISIQVAGKIIISPLRFTVQ